MCSSIIFCCSTQTCCSFVSEYVEICAAMAVFFQSFLDCFDKCKEPVGKQLQNGLAVRFSSVVHMFLILTFMSACMSIGCVGVASFPK